MKTNFFLFLMAIVAMLFGCQKESMQTSISDVFDITSIHTEKEYSISVYYPDTEFPTAPVPIIYLLDGYWYQDDMEDLVKELSEDAKIPTCILVSIAYKDGGYAGRFTDFIYPDAGVDSNAMGDKFFSFLKEELVPNIEQNYPSDTSRRTLLGHSLGGIFTLCSLFEQAENPLFKNCVAASNSIGLGTDNYVFAKEASAAARVDDLPVNLFISFGSIEGAEMNILHQELYQRLLSRQYPQLNISLQDYPYTHGAVAFPSFKNGLIYVFAQ